MTFKAVISQDRLKSIIDAVSHITDDAKLQISSDGLKIEAIDPANVAMVFLKASSEAFSFFQATEMTIALDIHKLSTLASGKEDVSLELIEDSHKLNIKVGRTKYTMSLLDPTAIKATPRLPQLDLPAQVAIQGSDLREAMQSATKVSDHVVVEQSDEEFKISAKGDIDSVEMPFALSELTNIRQGMSRALFSLDYLDDISKAAKSSEVTIETGIDYPMKLSFNLGNVYIQYLLAPRIEQE